MPESTRTRGKLLVATPPLLDPNFVRTVVLVLEHTDDGAIGVVLNRSTEAPLGEVLPAWGALAAGPGLVHVGGPVQPEGMIGLAEVRPPDDREDPGAPVPSALHELWPGLATVDLEVEPDAVAAWVRGIRAFVGYAGWGPGQLEGEVATGSWWVLDPLPADLWATPPDDLWPTVLRRQPGRLAWFAGAPMDPSTN